MDKQIRQRLIDLRGRIEEVESKASEEGAEERAAHARELVALYDELCDIYLREKAAFEESDDVSDLQGELLNAIEETLEAAQETALIVLDEMHKAAPNDPDQPDIVAFRETIEQMREAVDAFSHQIG